MHQPIARSLREFLFRLLIPLPPIQRNLALNLSGLGSRYQTGEGKEAGKRMPDLTLMSAQQKQVRLYELLRFPGYTLLLFINPDQVQNARSVLDRIAQSQGETLQVNIILNNGLPQLHDFGVNTLVDYRGDWETRLGAETGRALLLRPDGYVAFDRQELNADAILTHLQGWKCQPENVKQPVAV